MAWAVSGRRYAKLSVLHRANLSFEHQVKRSGFCEVSGAATGACIALQMIGSPTAFAGPAVDHGVGKRRFMAGMTQRHRVGQDGGIQSFDIVPLVNHGSPPSGFEIVFQFDAQRTVVVDPLQAAVDVAGLKNEASTFC